MQIKELSGDNLLGTRVESKPYSSKYAVKTFNQGDSVLVITHAGLLASYKVGDKVILKPRTGDFIKLETIEYVSFNSDDVLGTIED